MMKKRLLTLALILTLVCSLAAPLSVMADDPEILTDVCFPTSNLKFLDATHVGIDGKYVGDYSDTFDFYGFYVLGEERFSYLSIEWYEGTTVEGDPLAASSQFEEGKDYTGLVHVVSPYEGYTAEGMTEDDIYFIDFDWDTYTVTKADWAPAFTAAGDGFAFTVTVSSLYEYYRDQARAEAGNMPEEAARKLMVEDYLVPNTVKFNAMSAHQLATYSRSDFADGNTADFLGIADGIILSSGDASVVFDGKYDDGSRGGSYNSSDCYGYGSTKGDADLFNEFDDYAQYDTATLEFTVKAPEKNYPLSMTFNYAYMTMEMTESPEYNDVFALFVSDGKDSPDEPSDFTNYAIMKTDTQGSTGKVTVSNMKSAIYAADAANDDDGVFYVSEMSGVKFVDGSTYPNNFDSLEDYGLLYNGLTDVYTTIIPNIEGGKYYTIKFAIADASDSSYDGAVILQANSLYFGIEAPVISGITGNSVVKSFIQPEINLGVRNYGTVYIVPAGQAYTSENALKKAAAGVWQNSYKDGINILSGDPDAQGYAWSEDVSIAGIQPGQYVAYLVADFNGERVLSLPSEAFYVSPYISSLPGNFADPSVNTEHSAVEELTVNYGTAEYTTDPVPTLTAENIDFVTENNNAIIMPDEAKVSMSGDAKIETRGADDDGSVLTSEGSLALENNGNFTVTSSSGNGSGISAGDGKEVEISGPGNLTVNAAVGIQTTGDVTIGSNVVINASECGIDCDTLEVVSGSLTINCEDGEPLNVSKLIIPENAEIIGGSVDEEGNFTPEPGATQLIIRIIGPALTGTATIEGTPKVGETLTAELNDSNNSGELYYQWNRDGEPIEGATDSVYVPTEDDVDKEISVTITSSKETGSVTSESVTVEPADEPEKPVPITGDHSNTSLWMIMMLLAVAIMLSGGLLIKRRNDR